MRPLHLLLFACLLFTGIHCKKDNQTPADVQAQLQGNWQLVSESSWLPVQNYQMDTLRNLHIAGNVETIYRKDTLVSTDTFHIAFTKDQATKKRVPCFMLSTDTDPYLAISIKGDTLTFYTVNVQDGGESVYVRK
jgi:hypothetical protein